MMRVAVTLLTAATPLAVGAAFDSLALGAALANKSSESTATTRTALGGAFAMPPPALPAALPAASAAAASAPTCAVHFSTTRRAAASTSAARAALSGDRLGVELYFTSFLVRLGKPG